MKAVFAFALLAGVLPGATLTECREHKRRGRLTEERTCWQALAQSQNPAWQAEAAWGLGDYTTANTLFRNAVAARGKDPELRVRWGRLFLEHGEREEAAKLFQEALELSPDYPPALIGIASVASGRFESKATELAAKALEKDPKLYEARELLARLALEEYNEKGAVEEADKALAISPEAMNALIVRATVDWLNGKPGTEWVERLDKINPNYGEGYALAAGIFVINRRYEEGIALYRKALGMNPALLHAKAELGVNLMRLGEEKEARQLLEECYEARWRTPQVTNTLRLMDSYKNFVTFKKGMLILRVHKKEAELLRPYFEAELERASNVFEKKYQLKLTRPVQLEVYPDHEDFAVRTMGLPGLGALGVTFGNVVAMDSPSGRKPGSFHWASTLWHELSHVYALAVTKHRVPRWFTEGLAVHEETAVNKEWGDRLDPSTIRAIKEDKLLPVATLDRGFVRPSYPAQVTVSYFQAGKICDYIDSKWGWQKLVDMLRDFSTGKTTVEVMESHLGMKTEEFDKEFRTWLDQQVGGQVKGYESWRKSIGVVGAMAKEQKWDDVIKASEPLIRAYPDYVDGGSAYELLADAAEKKGDKAKATSVLEAWAKAGGRQPETLKRLAKLQEEAGNKRAAAETLERINYIYPVQDEAYHKRQGELWLELGDMDRAIREFTAVIGSNPVDAAGSYYNLAKALRAAGKTEEARENVVLALEAAPSFRPAQKLLLELSK
ncbi:MAG TPA: tetratricopeptide repeat protein [Bryobacteraceae bacterium]|nr:tetratricopeptide repeat protein [Bryobacteraceae bacterium]